MIALAAALVAVAAPSFALDFLTTGQDQYLTDQQGGRLVSLPSMTHSVLVLSSWPSKISLSIIASVNEDLQAITILGFAATDDNSVTKTDIMTVDAERNVKLLAACQGPRCDFVLAKSAMHPSSNDVWLLATTTDGKQYGATTKMSPP